MTTHTHGPSEGRGLDCGEIRLADGSPLGRCYLPVLRKAQAEALEEAADAWESGTVDFFEIKYLSDAPLGWSDESVGDAIMSSGPTMDWLRNRAQQLKEES